jgi:phosphotransferase system enzyme I (PtsI)
MSVKPSTNEIHLRGIAVSEGVVLGRVFVVERAPHDAIPLYKVPDADIEAEQQRLRHALEVCGWHLGELIDRVRERIGEAQAGIFVAQKLMVEDPVLVAQMMDTVATDHLNAEAAVDKTLDSYEALLLEVDDEYLKDRASDIGEIRRRLLDTLSKPDGEARGPARQMFELEEPRIIVAEELTPGETVSLDTSMCIGFVTERGGKASHAAILARALGIPAVSGIKGIHTMLSHGQEVLLNGNTGELVLWPSAETLRTAPGARRSLAATPKAVDPVDAIQVYANISLCQEIDQALTAKAEGIGLYRTEFECFAADRLLSEDEHYERYRRVVEAMDGKPVYIRLLDFGADKTAHFFDIPKEENPCLGYRGARLLHNEPEVLIKQARGIARASKHGPIHVIYPMIVDLTQFIILREMFRQNCADIDQGEVIHGVMFEVPSACLAAREILEVAEFGSIGTNDLIQYLFAVDRNNGLVAYDYGPDRTVFWNLVEQIAAAGRELGRPVSVCGEIGGQAQYLPKLLDAGVRCVSVSPRLIGVARLAGLRYQQQHPAGH